MWIIISEEGIKTYNARAHIKEFPNLCLVITTESTPRYEEHWSLTASRKRGVERPPRLRFRVFADKECVFETAEITTYDFIKMLGINSRDLNMILTHARPDLVEPTPKPSRFNQNMRRIQNRHKEYDPDVKFSAALHYVLNTLEKFGYEDGVRTFCDIGATYGPGDEFAPCFPFGPKRTDWLFARDKTREVPAEQGHPIRPEWRKKANRRH